MKLPSIFEERMQNLLGPDYDAFRESFENKPFYGLRVNTLKISVERFLEIAPFRLRPIPWVPEGFYFEETDRPSKHPFYHAGLYYIQEPSAMSPAVLLDPQPGETVLDTCAAPGGKSCQIAARLGGRGLLVTNDISATRVKALLHNIEISGIRNAIVLCEDPSKLTARMMECFDRVLVDAPCSGEGMFRKSPDAVRAWGDYKQEDCRAMQGPILEAASELLKPGGSLVYSTCTFNRHENEEMIFTFLKNHPDFRQSPGALPGFVLGFPGPEGEENTALYRLWPHRVEGEGHFISRLRKADGEATHREPLLHDPEPPECFREFQQQYLPEWQPEGTYLQIGDRLMLVPEHCLPLKGLRVIRAGWYLGDVKKGRFEPSQALALGLTAGEFTQTLDFDPEDPALIRYLKGETLHLEAPKGWILITVKGYPLGWAKGVTGLLKNHYPAAWRRMEG